MVFSRAAIPAAPPYLDRAPVRDNAPPHGKTVNLGVTMDALDDMRLIAEIVRVGSFSAAAHALGVTKQRVSRRVIALEDRLGARLLLRTTRKLSPTDAGLAYVARARRILADVAEAEREVGDRAHGPRGALRLSAPMSFGISHLAPVIAAFMARHPGVEIDIGFSDRLVDIVGDGYDMAIRIGRLTDSSLIARRLAAIAMVFCASPDYIARRGNPRRAADLAGHDCMLYDQGRGVAWPIGGRRLTVAGPLRSNNGDMIREAAIAGLGIAVLPMFVIGQALADGRLVPVLRDVPPLEGAIHAIYPRHRQSSELIRALVDHLVVAFADRAWSAAPP